MATYKNTFNVKPREKIFLQPKLIIKVIIKLQNLKIASVFLYL